MDFDELQREKTAEIEQIIERFLPCGEGLQKTIFEAMNYALKAGGKRLRPMFMAETYTLFGGSNPAVLEPFMAALEMIHTYSLVHDDLPALDNDDYRRSRATTHVVFGEAMGILAGDALLNSAFETAAGAFEQARDDHEFRLVAKAVRILARKPGIYGMIGGQVVDVELSGQPVSEDVLMFIYANKTSALIQCAMMIGAVLAGAGDGAVADISKAADAVGIAFQIQDDILDVTGTMEELGKPIGSDEKNNKTTYVTLKGLEEAQAQVSRLSQKALDILAGYNIDTINPYLKELILRLIHRRK